jgi:hypothetical protein
VDQGIEIKVVYSDEHLVELRVRACNGHFLGTADVYVDHDELRRLAQSFDGFPRNAQDERHIQLGTFDPSYGGGGTRMRLHCLDSLGHCAISVELRTDAHAEITGESQTATLVLVVEPALIDEFIPEFRRLAKSLEGPALLRCIPTDNLF